MANTLGTITTAAYVVSDPWSKIDEENPQKSVARFRVLHNPYGKGQDGKDLPPIAVNYVAFGKQAGVVASYIRKGSCPTVIGNINSLDLARKDGKLVTTKNGDYIINLEAHVIQLHLGAKGSENAGSNTQAAGATGEIDDLSNAPF
jgi:single-stranded DNA-binding protein